MSCLIPNLFVVLVLFHWNIKEIIVLTSIILVRYRRKRDKLVDRSAAARIPTMWGPSMAYCYRSIIDGIEHIAMVKVSDACNFDSQDCDFYFS